MKRKKLIIFIGITVLLFAADYFIWDRRNFLEMSIKNVLAGLIITLFYAPATRLREHLFNKVAKKYIKKDI
jgi:hypothetical protein